MARLYSHYTPYTLYEIKTQNLFYQHAFAFFMLGSVHA
jgi:hypothetical protein